MILFMYPSPFGKDKAVSKNKDKAVSKKRWWALEGRIFVKINGWVARSCASEMAASGVQA